MANSVTVRTTAPGAKQAAGDVMSLRGAFDTLGKSIPGLRELGSVLGTTTTQSRGLTGNVQAQNAAFGSVAPYARVTRQEMLGVGLAFGGAAAAAGAISGVMQDVGKALGQSALAAMDEEQNIAKLNAALAANVQGWRGNTDAIESQIKTRESLAFSDDDLRDSLAQLTFTTHDVTKAFDAQSLAMDIARAKNMSLHDASILVGKVLAGNTTGLKRLGINLEGVTNATQALQKLDQMFGGQAQKYAETTTGSMESLNIAIQDVNESLGSHMLPLIKSLAGESKSNLVPSLQEGADAVGGLIDVIAMSDAERAALAASWIPLPAAIKDALIPGFKEVGTQSAEALNTSVIASLTRSEHEENAAAADLARSMETAFNPDFTKAIDDAITGTVDTLHKSESEVADAVSDLTYAINHPLEALEKVAYIEGELAGGALAAGLASQNPFIRAQAIDTRERLIAEWEKITGIAYNQGYDAGQAYRRALRDATAGMHFPVPSGHSNVVVGGSGRARGGPVAGNGIYEVNEQGEPEVLTSAGRTYLLMGRNSGQVEPMGGPSLAVAPSPGMPTRIDVHVNLSTRDFAAHQKHYAVVQSGGPAFR